MDNLIYLDNAATSFPKPEETYVAMDQFSMQPKAKLENAMKTARVQNAMRVGAGVIEKDVPSAALSPATPKSGHS